MSIHKYPEQSTEKIIQLQNIVKKINKNLLVSDDVWNWLDKFNPSQAFLVCIGAGPWKIKRRTLIQQQAVNALGDKDLSEIDDVSKFRYPLEWQNNKVSLMMDYLKRYKISMSWFTDFITDMEKPAEMLYQITKTKQRAKVLDLFVRDYIKAPSFPIDRWVERTLKENGFPLDENYMIELCNKAGLNPREVARLFISNGNFTGNGNIII